MIINKNHPEIMVGRRGRDAIYMSLPNRKDLYFTSAAAKLFNLKGDRYIHFDNTDGKWMFFQNDDPDGFMLHADKKPGCQAVRIINKTLVNMIRRSTQYKDPGTRFMLLGSEARVGGAQVIEIITSKSYNEMTNGKRR